MMIFGHRVNSSGSFSAAIANLRNKATKAMFKLRNSIFQSNLNPRKSLYLFDTLIRPIYTYGEEIWGAFLGKLPVMFDVIKGRYEMFDEAKFETLDLRFCKSVLGVHRKASNAAVRGELGRYPQILFIIKQVIKNWLRIASYKNDTILYDTYLCNLKMLSEKKKCWLNNIFELVHNKLGLKYLWQNQGCKGKGIQAKYSAVSNMKHIFHFQWLNYINNGDGRRNNEGNKLRTYCTVKKNFTYENYLDFNNDFRLRRELTKLRISAHRLEIEIGRYKSPKIP